MAGPPSIDWYEKFCKGPEDRFKFDCGPTRAIAAMDDFTDSLSEAEKKDVVFVDNLIKVLAKNPKFDWNKSSYPSLEAKASTLHPKVIVKILAGLESVESSKKFKENNFVVRNKMKLWLSKLLKMLYESDDIQFKAWKESSNLEEIVKLQKLYVSMDRSGNFKKGYTGHALYMSQQESMDFKRKCYLAISNSYKFLERWTDAIRYCKKALKLCAQAQPQDLGKLLDCYQKLIESQVKNKSYNDALETFEKIKIYNLNSLNSEDVDFKTLMSEALEIYKIVNDHLTGQDHRLNRHKSKQLLKGLHSNPDPQNEQAQQMKKFINVRKIHLILGHLCQLKSEIFNGQDNQEERCKWLQLSCTIYNYFFDEFEDDRGLIVTDWLAAKGKGLEAKQNMEDLVERIIYAVITVNAYQKKSKTGDFLEEPETQETDTGSDLGSELESQLPDLETDSENEVELKPDSESDYSEQESIYWPDGQKKTKICEQSEPWSELEFETESDEELNESEFQLKNNSAISMILSSYYSLFYNEISIEKFIPRSVSRFSISEDDFLDFLPKFRQYEYLHTSEHGNIEEHYQDMTNSSGQIYPHRKFFVYGPGPVRVEHSYAQTGRALTYKNSMLINRHFKSYFN